MQMQVDPSKCPQDHRCPAIKVCPVQAITQDGHALPVISEDDCIDCGECIDYCPLGAFVRID